jgi:uncharacterized protein YdhG (YjbR/CyaY superfamily)
MSPGPNDFDDRLAQVPEPARSTLQSLRETIRAAVPEATETVSYGLPAFKYRGKPLLALGAARDHCSLHLMGYIPKELEADLEKYETSKGAVRFPLDEPLPASLVRKIVKVRVAQVANATGRGAAR